MRNSIIKQMTERMRKDGATEEEINEAVEKHYKYIKESNEYIGDLLRDQYRGKYSPRKEKENATMRILYDEDN